MNKIALALFTRIEFMNKFKKRILQLSLEYFKKAYLRPRDIDLYLYNYKKGSGISLLLFFPILISKTQAFLIRYK